VVLSRAASTLPEGESACGGGPPARPDASGDAPRAETGRSC